MANVRTGVRGGVLLSSVFMICPAVSTLQHCKVLLPAGSLPILRWRAPVHAAAHQRKPGPVCLSAWLSLSPKMLHD